jgi:nuclear pore complex protein Nup88
LFVWSRRESNLLAVCLNKDLGGGGNGTRTQTFDLTDTPVFEIDHLLSSPTGRWICLYGSRGVSCVELPRRSGKFGRFGGGAERVTVRSFSLAERFFLCQTRLFVNQVQFHPGSSLDGHLVVLASDNYLRIYNVDQDRSTPEQNICLSGRSNNKTDNKSTSNLFAESGLSVKGSLGEIAVGFRYGAV